ncbi:DUF1329 domain-containing protein [Thalassotalea maritima]|uniref:DUF1329 domain-containing protein n=1 Tax=Thalassotalea maritima TaxID=3242416 RepID=UPI00352932C2
MKFNKLIIALAVAPCFMNTAAAQASKEDISKLGNELTCVGAEAAANADGTIPAYTGKWLGTPEGIEYTPNVGQHPVDPYADEKPRLTITAANYKEHQDKLTPGQVAMFERYPETFEIPVYPGHRDFRYPDVVCDVAKKNAQEAVLVDNGFGFTGYMGAVPFPIPDPAQPMQLLANHNFPYRAFSYYGVRDVALVDSDGDISWGTQDFKGINLTLRPEDIGKPYGEIMAKSITKVIRPARNRGNATVSVEPNNFAQSKRLAWTYNPGTRRVRQLPEYGFDTALGSTSGKMTIDSDRLMNGSPERYNWSFVGKKEIYIPANAFKIHEEKVTLDDVLGKSHANPELMRYELRRVWVLEGKLKEGYRHRYGRRTLYLDEDSYHAIISDFYDTRDELVQHAYINYYYAFDAESYEAGSSFYHDLVNGGYVGYALTQDQERGNVLNTNDLDEKIFTPASLRRMSH